MDATLSPALLMESVACSRVDFSLSGFKVSAALSVVLWRLAEVLAIVVP